MTGLLMKDLMMLKCQKQFFFVMGVVGLMFLVIYDNPTLVFGYLTIMFSFIPLTTLAYDDADNGSAYLFTLPVSRKGYLVEKYLFSAGFTLAAALLTLAVVIVAVVLIVRKVRKRRQQRNQPNPPAAPSPDESSKE